MSSEGEFDGDATATPRKSFDRSGPFTTLLVALVVFLLAFDHGAFGVTTWASTAIGTWWIVLLVAGVGLGSRGRPSGWSLAPLGLLLAFAAFTGLSGIWATGAEPAFLALERILLYAGVLSLVLVFNPTRTLPHWLDGIALGITAVSVLAIVSRCFPSLIAPSAANVLVSGATTRLSYPVGYWNALAMLAALAWPLLLRIAVHDTRLSLRALALAPVPAIFATVYFASSRVGVVTLAVGGIVFVCFAARRWSGAAAALISTAAGIATVAWIARQHELVEGPLTSAQAAAQGHRAVVLLALTGLAAAGAFAFAERRLRDVHVPPILGRCVAAVLVVTVIALVTAAHPVRRWDEFTASPASPGGAGYIQNHLLSTNGNYRWQYWRSTLDELETRPLIGRGAGSFEAWWSAHGSVAGFVANPHSLYFETLGDLGIVGILLLAGTILSGAAVAIVRLRGAPDARRTDLAAAVASFVAFAVAIGVDWVWEVPVVPIVGFAVLGLALAGGSAQPRRARRRVAGKLAFAALAIVVVLSQADLLIATTSTSSSQAAATRGDLATAQRLARRAQLFEPWAASPYVQMALVKEAREQLPQALDSIQTALDREHADWRIWYIAARIERKLGRVQVARASEEEARALNPNSPLLANAG